MRTTLVLPDDVYELARSVSRIRGISLGDAVAELVRAPQRRPVRIDNSGVFPTFDLPEDAPEITLEQTLAAKEELF